MMLASLTLGAPVNENTADLNHLLVNVRKDNFRKCPDLIHPVFSGVYV